MNADQDRKPEKRKPDANQGEGNREAARRYDEAQRRFVESGNVEQAVRDAATHSPAEEEEPCRAEDEGRSHAKEEDPAVALDNTQPAQARQKHSNAPK